MTAVELLEELEVRDAYLVAEGDQIAIDAPRGGVPPALIAELRRRSARFSGGWTRCASR
jgi:hypothetical protein